ncbi:hypothetical protein QUC26_17905 [Pseudomonas asiatica]|uniref:hypothetical protein n=1 Tax=Pseudomonas asiatica TaxID=2219225 RepID=UPI0025A019A8|nr:hypothetical protein [Pseudomonas asiatica]MDM9589632.1 hypothetical protein [Pseudomonas asiatica]WJM51741.1 hypothetical protein QUC26_17905 [Pseudomonas asiatica]
MPTENRSSNTEMASFPRELSDDLAELIAHRARVCGGGAFEIWEAICEGFAAPAQQPHPEPIAWMVGTAFWWTKEEAERDAAETGLQIVGLGPMTSIAPAQHQGEPVALPARKNPSAYPLPMDAARGYGWNACLDEIAKLSPLYTHADPGEVERLRAQLAERDALLHSLDCAWNSHDGKERFGKLMRKVETLAASAEPSVPAAQPGKCLDGGDCGIGGTCKWCPHTTASPAQQPS